MQLAIRQNERIGTGPLSKPGPVDLVRSLPNLKSISDFAAGIFSRHSGDSKRGMASCQQTRAKRPAAAAKGLHLLSRRCLRNKSRNKNSKYLPFLPTFLLESWTCKGAQFGIFGSSVFKLESMNDVVQIGPGSSREAQTSTAAVWSPGFSSLCFREGQVPPSQLPDLLGKEIHWRGQRTWAGEQVSLAAGGGMVEKLSRREPCSLAGWGSSKKGAASGNGWHPRRG